MRLKDKICIVTGGGSGYGEGICALFAQHGGKILVCDIVMASAERVARDIVNKGGQATAFAADVSQSADTEAMFDEAQRLYGGVDVLVNNAGISHSNQPMLDVSEEEFDQVYAVNVKALYYAAIHGVPVMRKRGGGVIINTVSTAALRPRPGLTWYNGSKGAALLISKSMALELAPDGIRVNAICPVIGETGLTTTFMGGDSQELRDKFVSGIPLGRFSQPRDIAHAALWLASEDADFITGIALEVDGGRCV